MELGIKEEPIEVTTVLKREEVSVKRDKVRISYRKINNQSSEIKFQNCTSHQIKIVDKKEKVLLNLDPADQAARIKQRKKEVTTIKGIPIVTSITKEAENLPSPKPGVIYIVSGFLKNSLPHRGDLVAPDISAQSVVHDEDNNIEAIKRLTK